MPAWFSGTTAPRRHKVDRASPIPKKALSETVLTFNIVGIVMLVVAVVIGAGVREIAGATAEGPEMILMGALAILFDVTYRVRQPEGHWISPFGGGNIMFIPVWLLGASWFVVGIVYSCTRPVPLGLLGLGMIALLVVAALGLAVFQLIRCDRPDFWQFAAAEKSSASNEPATPQPKKERSDRRCPACKLPAKSAELDNGKCPWCGASVSEPEA